MKGNSDMAQHIFLTGKKHIGKSTLIKKILADYKGTVDGFLTLRTKEYLGDHYSVHMCHIKENEIPNEQNLLFLCGKADKKKASDIFNHLGCNILSKCTDCSLIIMDELGPHEADAVFFRQKVLSLLDSSIPILGILQEPAESSWPEIVNHPNVEVIPLTEENREDASLIEYISHSLNSAHTC